MKTVSGHRHGAPVKMRIACPGLTAAFEEAAAWTRRDGKCLLFLLRQSAAREPHSRRRRNW
jgi:hypothetical protein